MIYKLDVYTFAILSIHSIQRQSCVHPRASSSYPLSESVPRESLESVSSTLLELYYTCFMSGPSSIPQSTLSLFL